MTFGHKLVFRSATFLFVAFRSEQVPKAGRAAHQLALGGQLEALGDGLFGLLHEESGRKQRTWKLLARVKNPFFREFPQQISLLQPRK